MDQRIESAHATNHTANHALVEWDDNIAISDAPASQLWPRGAERCDGEAQAAMMRWHALPTDWWLQSRRELLLARRLLISDVTPQGYRKLVGAAP